MAKIAKHVTFTYCIKFIQRRPNIVYILYKCYVLLGYSLINEVVEKYKPTIYITTNIEQEQHCIYVIQMLCVTGLQFD